MLRQYLSGSSSLSIKAAALAVVAMVGMALPAAHASLLVYEPFNYTAGSNLNGQTATGLGLTGSWSAGNATIASGSLSEGNLATSANSLIGGASNVTQVNLTSPISATAGNPLWVSFLIQTPTTATEVTGGWGGLVLELSSTNVYTYPFIGYANSGVFVVQTQGGGNDVNGPSVSPNTTYLMVLEDIANSSGPDTLNLWVNPATGVTAPSGTPTITDNLIGPIGDISGIGTNDGSYSNSYDEIRIGTSYADVTPVPEPATLGLVAIGGLGLLLLKRRKAV